MTQMTSIGLYVIFGVVLLPLYVMLGGWFFDEPRDFRSPVIGLGYVVGFVVAIVIGIWIMGFLLSFVLGY